MTIGMARDLTEEKTISSRFATPLGTNLNLKKNKQLTINLKTKQWKLTLWKCKVDPMGLHP